MLWFSLQIRCRSGICPFLKNKLFTYLSSECQPSYTQLVQEGVRLLTGLLPNKFLWSSLSAMAPAFSESLWAQVIQTHQVSNPVMELFFSFSSRKSPLSLVQSSLSERVSYCAERRGAGSRSHILLGWWEAAWLTDGGAQAIEVGGVLLNMRIVKGLYGNWVDPAGTKLICCGQKYISLIMPPYRAKASHIVCISFPFETCSTPGRCCFEQWL